MSVEKYIGGGVFVAFDWERGELILRKPDRGGEHCIELTMEMMCEIDSFMGAMQRLLRRQLMEAGEDPPPDNVVRFNGKPKR